MDKNEENLRNFQISLDYIKENKISEAEKLLTKKQLITMTSQGAKVTPQLFNPVMKILENVETKSQKDAFGSY